MNAGARDVHLSGIFAAQSLKIQGECNVIGGYEDPKSFV